MSSTTGGQKPPKWYAMERALAPHVDKKWANSFVLELRMLDVEGRRIGAALSEVESHCSDSGQSAQEAFGDPVEYARSLQLPALAPTPEPPRAALRSAAPVVLQILGMVLLSSSFADWLRGQQTEITTGNLVNMVALVLGTVAMGMFADLMIRVLMHHPIRLWLAFMASTAVFMIPLMLLDEVIWRVSVGWGLAAGGAALAGGVAWALEQHRTDGPAADLITSPFENAAASSGGGGVPGSAEGPSRPSRLEARLGAAMIMIIPVLTLLLLAIDLVIHYLSQK